MNKATNLGARLMGIGCLIMILMFLIPVLILVVIFISGMASAPPP